MLDGKANGCSQWFLSHRSVASGLEKPLLAGYAEIRNFSSSVEKYFQHEKRNLVSASGHVMFYLLYKCL